MPLAAPIGNPERYFGIYRGLSEAHLHPVIIGGQACNLWAVHYARANPGLRALQPYTSLDVDLCCKSQGDVKQAARHFGVEPVLNDPSAPSPVLGYVVVPVGDAPVMVQFLNGAFGIRNSQKIFGARQDIDLNGELQVSVMHPMQLLQSKAALVLAGHRAHKAPQDLKHLRMAVLFTQSFILDVAQGDAREAINLCKRALDLTASAEGLEAFWRHGVRIEESVPVEALTVLDAPKVSAFLTRTYPACLERIRAKRQAAPFGLPEAAAPVIEARGEGRNAPADLSGRQSHSTPPAPPLQASEGLASPDAVVRYELHLRKVLRDRLPAELSATQRQNVEEGIRKAVQGYAAKVAKGKVTPEPATPPRSCGRKTRKRAWNVR